VAVNCFGPLHAVRYSDELLPLVSHRAEVTKIQSPSHRRPCFWASTVLLPARTFLARLESLWTAWHDRASELQVATMNFSASAKSRSSGKTNWSRRLPPHLHMRKIGKLSLRRSIGYVPAALRRPAAKVADGHRVLNL